MIKFENDCCDCAVPAYPCMGNSCPLRHSAHFYCDNCSDEVDELYYYGGEQWCVDCILKDCGKVDIDD